MLRRLVEQGLASAMSRFMLQNRLELVFEQVRRLGALSDEQLQQLRDETQRRLAEVEREGRESLELLQRGFGSLLDCLLGKGPGGPRNP